MKIQDLFRRPIDRTIEEVIKVDLADEEIVALEIAEYVTTDHLQQSFVQVLEEFQEIVRNPSERTNIWVSGFFGSGKSSFAKLLGYLISNPTLDGQTAANRFLENVDGPTIPALLNTIHSQGKTVAVFLDLSTARNVAREGESIVLPVYRSLLQELGYSRNLILAELEYDLEGDGDLAVFENAFQQVSKGGAAWTDRRDVGLAKSEASHALHQIRPETHTSPDSWARSAAEPEINANWFAERAEALLARRGNDASRILLVVDEVGQYVARSVNRMQDLQGLAEAIQTHRGSILLAVTSQEKLDDVVDSLEGRQIELARVQDRFPIRVDLLPSDIEEVTSKRILAKTTAGREELSQIFRANRNRFIATTRLSSPTRAKDPTEEELLRLYPLVPYQVQLLIDAVSARRAHGGASPILGGSNRTIIKLAQQLIVDSRAGLGEHEVGDLVTLDRAYELLESVIPTAWQAEVEQVATKYESTATETRLMRSIALCSDVGGLPLTEENLAVILHPGITAESDLPAVQSALENLVKDDRLRHGDDGYELQSAEQKDWEKRRRQIDARPADATRIRRLVINDALSALSVQRGKAFKVAVSVEGEKLTDGDIDLQIDEADADRRTDFRNLSREAASRSMITWVFEESEDTYEAVLEFHRSRAMIERNDTASKSPVEVELLGEERARQARWERLVAERLTRDLEAGHVIFRGVVEDVDNGSIRSVAQKLVSDRLESIYERIDEFSASISTRDVLAVLHADDLDGINPQLRDEGIGLTETTPQGEQVVTTRDPLLAVLTEIKERSAYGTEASGKHLESTFAGPPYGAPVEVVQAVLAAGIRSGLIDVIHQGARIRGAADQRLDRVFSALPQFRAAAYVPPVDDEVSLDIRADLAENLSSLLGAQVPVATDQLAVLVRSTFRDDNQMASRVIVAMRGLDLAVPGRITRLCDLLTRLGDGADAEVVTSASHAWVDLLAGRELLYELDGVLETDMETLREAQEQVRGGETGLSLELIAERIELADILAGEEIGQHIGRIHAIAERISTARQAQVEDAAKALRDKLDTAVEEIRERYPAVEAIVLDEVMKPLDELRPAGDVSPADLGECLARLEAAEVRAGAVSRQLDEIIAKGKVAHIAISDLVMKPIETEEDLDVALDRMRQAVSAELASGKQVRLT